MFLKITLYNNAVKSNFKGLILRGKFIKLNRKHEYEKKIQKFTMQNFLQKI